MFLSQRLPEKVRLKELVTDSYLAMPDLAIEGFLVMFEAYTNSTMCEALLS